MHSRVHNPVPGQCPECLVFLEVNQARELIGELFERKFNTPFRVDYGHHQIAFYKRHEHHYVPLGYLNMLPYKQVILVGGGMTDGRAFKHVEPQHASQISAAGGVLYWGLKHAFSYYADQCLAFFGYVDDERAHAVDLKAGFADTEHDKLVVNFHKPLSTVKQRKLIRLVHQLGPF